MDDDFWGALFFWLIAIAVGLYCVYLFIVYALPWILLVGVAVGLPGYGLTRLLTTQRFQLSSKSAIVLFFVVGFTAWVTSMVVVSSTGMSPWFSLLIAPSFFYTQGLILLSVWALWRVAKGWKQLYLIQRQLQHSETVIAGLEQGVKMARLEIEGIDQAHGEQMRKVKNITEEMSRLCAREPRALGLLVRKEHASVSSMTAVEIQHELQAIPNDHNDLGHRVRALLLQKELIQRNVDTPLQELDLATKNLQNTQLRLKEAQKVTNRLAAEKERFQNRRDTMKGGTIVL